MAYVLTDEATYTFSYSITNSSQKTLSRSLSGLNASNSATGQDTSEIFTKGSAFFALIYSPTGFSSIDGFTPKSVTKKLNVGVE